MKLRASILVLVALLLALLLLTMQGRHYLALLRDPLRLRGSVLRLGAWAPLAIVGLHTIQVVAAPIPGAALGLASGYLFGVAWGTFYSVIGTALGSLLAFMLARTCGRPLVERLVPAATLARLDASARRRGLFFFVLVFLLPFLPDDLACFAAGLTPIPIPALMLAVLAGRPPGIFVSCWLGANAVRLNAAQWAAVIACSALLAVGFLLYGERLQEWSTRLVNCLTNGTEEARPDGC